MRGGRARRSSSRSCCDASVIGTQRVVRVCDCLRRFGGAYVVPELRLSGWRLPVRGAGVFAGLEYNPGLMARRAARKSGGKRKAGTSRPHKHGASKEGKLPKDAVTLVVLLKAREGQGPFLEAELRALVGPTRREDGCIRYDLHRGLDVGGVFLLHEVWATREHHRLHRQTPHFIRWNARKDALLASHDATFWTQIA
jgi:quinol monooxygenase YgiN